MSREKLTVHLLIINPEYLERTAETIASSKLLGVKTLEFGDFEPERMDTVAQQIICELIETSLNKYSPDAIAIPDIGASHQDHRAVSQAAMSACRPSGMTSLHRPSIVLAYEEVADAWQPNSIKSPNFTVSLEQSDLNQKIAAMSTGHKSQVRDYPSERSLEAISALAIVRGVQAGVPLGESYNVLRWLS